MRGSRRQRVVWIVGVVAVLLVADAIAVTGAAALPLRKREVNPSGAWSWFGDPRAVYHQGAHRRTYVGWVDARGNVQVASYDHDTRVREVATLKANFQIDDHDNPSLLVRPDGHLMAFWSAHIGTQMYYRRTTRPEDVTAWEPEQTVGTNRTRCSCRPRATGSGCSGGAATSTRPSPPPATGWPGRRRARW